MKIKSTIIALLVSVTTFGQVDDAVKTVVTKEIRDFSKTLDSVLVVEKDAIGIFYIDTLIVPDGKLVLFELSLAGISTVGFCSAVKYVVISNSNGKYTILRNLNPMSYSGYTGSKWDVLLVNGLPMVRITSPVFSTWAYKRY